MTRGILAVVGGVVAWFLIATIGNLALRSVWPGYAEVEKAMSFTLGMMVCRLILGALSSFGAGMLAAWVARRNGHAVKVLAGVLVAMFIPVHYLLWDKFPLWYHLIFLASLVLMTLLGALIFRSRRRRTLPSAGGLRVEDRLS